jgi:hypothetical protein
VSVLHLVLRLRGGGDAESRECKCDDMLGGMRTYTIVALGRLLDEIVQTKTVTDAVSFRRDSAKVEEIRRHSGSDRLSR